MKHDTSFGVLTGNAVETISFKAGDVIFREGDNALDLFVIKSGQVRIQIGNRTVAEFCWTCTTPLLLHVMKLQPADAVVTYVDADLRFFSVLLDNVE